MSPDFSNLPRDWRAVPIGETIVESQYGLSVSSDPEGSTPIIGMKDMSGGKILAKDWARVSLTQSERERFWLNRGDILLNRTNSNDLVGKIALWDREEEAVFASYLVRLVLDPRLALPTYVNHYLNADDSQRRLKQLATRGVSQANINPTTFKQRFVIALPPVPEQQRIAAVLDAWDEAIAITEGLSAAKRRQFEYLRATILTGRIRLPGFTGEWVTVPLSDVLTEHGLLSTGQQEVFSVSVHRGLVNQIEHLGRSFAASSTGHYRRVRPGDVVYTKSPTGDFPLGIIKQSKVDREVIVSPLYGVFTPETRALGAILDAYFSAPSAAQSYLAPLVQKGAKNTIAVTNDRFLEGALRLPRDRSEQEALATLVSVALTELAQLSALADRLRLQKRGLMQKLLTGAWRVPSSADALMQSGRPVPEAAE